jgi:hypothetical protein
VAKLLTHIAQENDIKEKNVRYKIFIEPVLDKNLIEK